MSKFVTVQSAKEVLTEETPVLIYTRSGKAWPVYDTVEEAMDDVKEDMKDQVVPVTITIEKAVN